MVIIQKFFNSTQVLQWYAVTIVHLNTPHIEILHISGFTPFLMTYIYRIKPFLLGTELSPF